MRKHFVNVNWRDDTIREIIEETVEGMMMDVPKNWSSGKKAMRRDEYGGWCTSLAHRVQQHTLGCVEADITNQLAIMLERIAPLLERLEE